MAAEVAKFQTEHTGSVSGIQVESRTAALITEALGSEIFEETLMTAVEVRLNSQPDNNLQGYMEAKIVIIQEELRTMLMVAGEVTATELRNLSSELDGVRNSATAASSTACPCASGNCPCKCGRED